MMTDTLLLTNAMLYACENMELIFIKCRNDLLQDKIKHKSGFIKVTLLTDVEKLHYFVTTYYVQLWLILFKWH